MAGKKTRNRNILSMDSIEIRGISSRTENHPLPERPEDALPLHYLESVKEALSSYVTPSASGMSSPTNEEAPNFLVLSHSHSGWTTGNSTERSSLFSWCDDEFDKQAAKTVQKMFDEIDDMLFEETKNAMTSLQIQNECKEWNGRFPHLRILGHQLLKPGDEGYQYYPSMGPRPATAGELLDVADHEVPGNSSPVPQGLTISGKYLKPLKAPVSDTSSNRGGESPPNQSLAYLEEEIFESDGFVEEYLAYDHYQDDEEHERKKYHAPRRKGFPPVTPNACMQNTVLSQTFDVLWAEVVVWMRGIVRKHSDFLQEEKRLAAQEDSGSQMSVLRPVEVPSYDLSYSPNPFGHQSGRLMDVQNRLAPMSSSMRLSTAPSFNFSIQPEQRGALNGVMTISSKPLYNRLSERAPSAMGDDASLSGMNTRPGSSNLMPRSSRPMSVRMSDNFSYNNYRQPSARGAKGRLKPLDRAKTPQQLEGMITGKRIVTANDRLGSPPHPTASPSNYHWSRNATLPPIEGSLQENNNQFPMRPMKSQNKFRISSAVVDDRGLRPRDKGVYTAFVAESRPNTTHTFRDDTPFGNMHGGRRSSTPQAFSMLKPPGSATGNRGNVPGGITGVSLGIPGSQSHLDTSSVGPYGGPQPNYFRVL